MLAISWNCRGLGRASAVHKLKVAIGDKNPDCVFLIETKLHELEMKTLLNSMGYVNFEIVPSVKRAGGICLAWRIGVDIRVVKANGNIITAWVFSDPCHTPWLLSCLYGPPYRNLQYQFWDDLNAIGVANQGPWLCIGDFNDILSQEDKAGGRPFAQSSRGGLNTLVMDNGLIDLGFAGNPYTWNNRRGGIANIKERLDRGLANSEWRSLFPKATVVHLPAIRSDHNPLLIDTIGEQMGIKRPFKFEKMWTTSIESFGVVDEAWSTEVHGSHAYRTCSKIRVTKKMLKVWNKDFFGNCSFLVKQLKQAIDIIQQDTPSAENLEREYQLQTNLSVQIQRETMLWRQKSRVRSIAEGDASTGFFHLSTIVRRRRNSIDFLKLPNGTWTSERIIIGGEFVDYFNTQLASSSPDIPPNLEGLVNPCISEAENARLSRIPTAQEIKEVMFSIPATKSPGPDGMSAIFYHTYWDIVGPDVIDTIQSFFRYGHMLKELNATFITLIPKNQQASQVSHFRPISLCNVLYKVISKIISNRIRPLLHKIVSPYQAAFITGRNIAENVVLTQEILHSFKSKRSKTGSMAIKIDMAKAYDKLEWKFIETVLRNLGFSDVFNNLIMECISSTHFRVLINGGPMGYISPSRGIRQGDPLSPFIFIICAEILSRILMREHEIGDIQGVKIAAGCDPINHLMFADDLVLFGPATRKEAEALHECLDLYCMWSGQEINYDKSGVCFSKNTVPQRAREVREVLQMGNISQDAMYLGMPFFPSRSKSKDFRFTLDRITARVDGWKSKLLSFAGRGTLIKSVLSAIPAYAMAAAKFPENLCHKMDQKLRKFWWGHTKSKNLCLKGWDHLCTPKRVGGLGFRRMRDANKALLAKLAWQVAAKEEKVWVKQLRAKYCTRHDFFFVEKRPSDSSMWKDILSCKELIEKGACYIIGNGKDVNIWTDPWVPNVVGFKVKPISTDIQLPFLVEELIDKDLKCWNTPLLQELFDLETIQEIKKIDIPLLDTPDYLCWLPSRNGSFTVKSAYGFDQDQRFKDSFNPDAKLLSSIWKSKIHERLKTFLWRCVVEALPARQILARRMPIDDINCPQCNSSEESMIHVFFQCNFARALWFQTWGLRTDLCAASTIQEWIYLFLNNDDSVPVASKGNEILAASLTMEEIWKSRNEKIRDELPDTIERKAIQIRSKTEEYMVHFNPNIFMRSMLQENQSWKSPPQGTIKVNFDAAIRDNFTVGACSFRDHNGTILGLVTAFFPPLDADAAEARAAKLAISEVVKRGWSKIQMEGDSLNTVNAILGNSKPPWNSKRVFDDISFCLKKLETWQCAKVSRASNVVAHELAKWAATNSFIGPLSEGSIPLSILNILNRGG